MLKKIFDFMVNLIYPPACVFCRSLSEPYKPEYICKNCKDNLPILKDKLRCIRCGKPVVSYGEKKMCYICLNSTRFYYKRIVSVFEYEGTVRESILHYKTNPIRLYASIYAEYMYQAFLDEYKNIEFDGIVSVPSNKNRLKPDGEYHIGLICEEFSKLSGLRYFKNCLIKIKKTKKQADLTYNQRQVNLKNCFRVKGKNVNGLTLLLIDDVCTTRATLKECSKQLRHSGAKAVYCLTLSTVVFNKKQNWK